MLSFSDDSSRWAGDDSGLEEENKGKGVKGSVDGHINAYNTHMETGVSSRTSTAEDRHGHNLTSYDSGQTCGET